MIMPSWVAGTLELQLKDMMVTNNGYLGEAFQLANLTGCALNLHIAI